MELSTDRNADKTQSEVIPFTISFEGCAREPVHKFGCFNRTLRLPGHWLVPSQGVDDPWCNTISADLTAESIQRRRYKQTVAGAIRNERHRVEG